MTGPAVPSDEELREALYHAVRGALVDWDDNPPVTEGTAASRLTDAVLPVVRRWADQRAAEELRVAADLLTDRARTWVLNQLRDRADALAVRETQP